MAGFWDYQPSASGAELLADTPAPVGHIRADELTEDQRRAVEICETYKLREAEAKEYQDAAIQGLKDGGHPGDIILLLAKCIDAMRYGGLEAQGKSGMYTEIKREMEKLYADKMFDTECPALRSAQISDEVSNLAKVAARIEREKKRLLKEQEELKPIQEPLPATIEI